MEECLSCGRGFHWECHLPEDSCCLEQLDESVLLPAVSSVGTGRPWKPDDEVEDPRSTMRKRAQKILKETRDIEIGSPCEWSGKANVGGGRHPILIMDLIRIGTTTARETSAGYVIIATTDGTQGTITATIPHLQMLQELLQRKN